MAIRARPPPPAVGVPVTRQRRAAAGPAHPAAAAPGQSRGEARRERRQVRPPGRKGRGLCQAGPSGRGGRVCVFWVAGVWVPEPAPVAVCALAPAVTEPEWALSQSRRCLWRSECTGLCACTRVFVWRGRRVCICVCSGPSLCLPRARGAGPPQRSLSCMGMFSKQASCGDWLCCSRSWRGSAAPTGLQGPGQPGDCRQTPEGGRGRASGRGPEACRRARPRWGD